MPNHLNGNEFDLYENGHASERKTHFDIEAKRNSEMGHLHCMYTVCTVESR